MDGLWRSRAETFWLLLWSVIPLAPVLDGDYCIYYKAAFFSKNPRISGKCWKSGCWFHPYFFVLEFSALKSGEDASHFEEHIFEIC